ncbi:uncharacterized protein LOC135107528 isoform X1 [Scylla paramamosain]|uniref:uncharacterized protein LOC135098967 isoform X1 n=2 Tax=Scylla paramamosain TaxID=85552 RepID=UPI003083ED17
MPDPGVPKETVAVETGVQLCLSLPWTHFPAPELNGQPAANLNFNQNSSDTAGQDNHRNTDMHAPDMDMKMEGQESHVMVSDSDASVQEGERQAETRKCPWEKPGVNRANESRIKLSIPVN